MTSSGSFYNSCSFSDDVAVLFTFLIIGASFLLNQNYKGCSL